jgi:hypothetical protein
LSDGETGVPLTGSGRYGVTNKSPSPLVDDLKSGGSGLRQRELDLMYVAPLDVETQRRGTIDRLRRLIYATGSKMTDVLGDVNKIIDAKRPDAPFMLVTDGITWMRRMSDLKKLVQLQNSGQITRIYTTKMAALFKMDLETLKAELKI